MPTVKVCVWNIQNYGTGDPAFAWGAASRLRNRFIVDFVREKAIDILMIEEAGSAAIPSLTDLATQLNRGLVVRDWAVSMTGSALRAHANNPPQNAGDVQFASDARYEGYAIAWRTAQARFRLVDALNDIAQGTVGPPGVARPASPLNLSTFGRPAGFVFPSQWGPLAGYTAANVFPYDRAGRVMRDWPALELPSTGKYNPATFALEGVRRPSYVVIELLDGPRPAAGRLVPVCSYHAPSRLRQAEWGAFLSNLARELYVSHTLDRAGGRIDARNYVSTLRNVMAGDFNYRVANADWPEWYDGFLRPLGAGVNGGAACTGAPVTPLTDVERSSTVRLSRDGTPIVGTRVDDYRALPIDLAFFPRNSAATLVNVPQEMRTTPAPYRATLQAIALHLNAGVAAFTATQRLNANRHGPEYRTNKRDRLGNYIWTPMLHGAYGATFQNWARFRAQLTAGRFRDARQVCEFYVMFVSDHLPLIIDINYAR